MAIVAIQDKPTPIPLARYWLGVHCQIFEPTTAQKIRVCMRCIVVALCLGKISGYADMLQALKMICLDNNVNRRQTVVVVLKFLSDHPEDIDETAPSLALAALTKAFPCSADASKK